MAGSAGLMAEKYPGHEKIIGIVRGMGPQAGQVLFERIIRLKAEA
jgi:hypothetical protein